MIHAWMISKNEDYGVIALQDRESITFLELRLVTSETRHKDMCLALINIVR